MTPLLRRVAYYAVYLRIPSAVGIRAKPKHMPKHGKGAISTSIRNHTLMINRMHIMECHVCR